MERPTLCNLDIKLTGCQVYDGTGNPWVRADIGIKGERIAGIGNLSAAPATRVINVTGNVVCPGFVDIHSHSDGTLLTHRLGLASLCQGITTQVVGNCGHSLAPVRDGRALLAKLLAEEGFGAGAAMTPADQAAAVTGLVPWTTFAEYLYVQERRGLGINIAPLLGHGTLRRYVMGSEGEGGERAEPTAAELDAMRDEVRTAMEAGAFGLSSGLEYPPGRNAKTAELVELCRIVAAHDGIYETHMRSEGQAPRMEWLGAILETVEIARLSGVRANIAHLKADQRDAWGKAPAALRLLDDARRHGIQITADLYPYPFAAVGYLYSVLPPTLAADSLDALLGRLRDPESRRELRTQLERGVPEWTNPAVSFGWGAIGIVETTRTAAAGKSIEDLAREPGADPFDVCFDLLLADSGLTRSSVGVMSEDNIRLKLQHPLTMVSTDGTTVDSLALAAPAASGGGPAQPPKKLHPRCFGTYPRLLGRYVREMGVLSLQEAIRKCTSLPAATAGIKDRGLIAEGAFADLVVFDPGRIAETATFAEPHQYPAGISYVLVNGRLAVDDGRPTYVLAGRVLRHKR